MIAVKEVDYLEKVMLPKTEKGEHDYLELCRLPKVELDYVALCMLPNMKVERKIEEVKEEVIDYISMCLLPDVKENRDYFADKEDYVRDMLMLPNKDDICAVNVMLPDGKEHWFAVDRDSADIYIGARVSVPCGDKMEVAEVRRVRYDAPHALAVLEHEGIAEVYYLER